MTSDDVSTLKTIRAVLLRELAEDTPSEDIDRVTASMIEAVHGPWYPQSEKQIVAGKSYILRGSPNGKQIGGITGGTQVLAGNNETGWTPILVHAWIATHLLK